MTETRFSPLNDLYRYHENNLFGKNYQSIDKLNLKLELVGFKIIIRCLILVHANLSSLFMFY